MEDDWIQISQLNDFIFCPASIYFHNLYGRQAVLTYQSPDQLKGTAAHSAIDQRRYSTHKNILQSLFVESSTYGLIGKIDLFDSSTKTLIERKKQIKTIYDGYIFQIYGQYFCMIEMGFQVDHLQLYSWMIIENMTFPYRRTINLCFKNLNNYLRKCANFHCLPLSNKIKRNVSTAFTSQPVTGPYYDDN